MKSALVIRYGDPDIADAIASGMNAMQAKDRKTSELTRMRAELEEAKQREAKLGVRVARDENYFKYKMEEASTNYIVHKSNPVTDALWGAIGLLVLLASSFSDWVEAEMKKSYE